MCLNGAKCACRDQGFLSNMYLGFPVFKGQLRNRLLTRESSYFYEVFTMHVHLQGKTRCKWGQPTEWKWSLLPQAVREKGNHLASPYAWWSWSNIVEYIDLNDSVPLDKWHEFVWCYLLWKINRFPLLLSLPSLFVTIWQTKINSTDLNSVDLFLKWKDTLLHLRACFVNVSGDL